MKISIVLPTYNRSVFLKNTINSILDQTFKNWELVIIDDGSTDNTRKIVSSFLVDKRIKYIYQKNQERSAARNTGINRSTGDYICFVDSDEKLNSIFAYTPHQHHRRGRTLEFANYIGKKYNIPVHHKPLYNDRPFDYMSSHDFVSLWSPHLYHFNLDSMETQPGQQCKLVASAGSINIGGVNDSHQFLYPETATCNLNKLEDVFVKYHEDENARFEAVRYAWERVNELSGFDNVKRLFKEEFLS